MGHNGNYRCNPHVNIHGKYTCTFTWGFQLYFPCIPTWLLHRSIRGIYMGITWELDMYLPLNVHGEYTCIFHGIYMAFTRDQNEAEGYPQRELFTHNALYFEFQKTQLLNGYRFSIPRYLEYFHAHKASTKICENVSRFIHCLILKRISMSKKGDKTSVIKWS